MAKTKKKWLNSPWTINIGTAIFSLLVTVLYDYFKKQPVLTTIWSILKWTGNIIWEFLNFDFKVWWLIVVALLLISFVIIVDKVKKEETFKPDFYSYREDKFKRWKWTWNWKFDNRQKAWIISDLQAHCPKCDTPMINHSNMYSLFFDCPRCDFKKRDEECDEPHKIERIILDNIDRREKIANQC